jgi:hypothetical protein
MQPAGHHGNIAAVIPVSGNDAGIKIHRGFLQGSGLPHQDFFELAASSSATSFFSCPTRDRPASAIAWKLAAEGMPETRARRANAGRGMAKKKAGRKEPH